MGKYNGNLLISKIQPHNASMFWSELVGFIAGSDEMNKIRIAALF